MISGFSCVDLPCFAPDFEARASDLAGLSCDSLRCAFGMDGSRVRVRDLRFHLVSEPGAVATGSSDSVKERGRV